MLGTASAAFAHSEGGTDFQGLQFKAEGQDALTVRYTYLQLGNPAICVWAVRDMQQTGIILITSKQGLVHSVEPY